MEKLWDHFMVNTPKDMRQITDWMGLRPNSLLALSLRLLRSPFPGGMPSYTDYFSVALKP